MTAYEGVFLDHPHLTGFVSHTSAVLKGPDGDGEIETLNSRYTLIGAETTDDTVRKAQRLYDSLPVLPADEGLAYAIAEQSDLSGAMSALMSVVDRTLADVERTEWERRVAAALLFESNWSTVRELMQRLRNRLLRLAVHRNQQADRGDLRRHAARYRSAARRTRRSDGRGGRPCGPQVGQVGRRARRGEARPRANHYRGLVHARRRRARRSSTATRDPTRTTTASMRHA